MMCSPGSQELAQLHAKKKASGAEAQGASAKRGGEQRKFGVRHSCLGCSYEKYDSRERDFLNQGRCFFKLIIDRCTRCAVLGEFLRNICVWNHRGFIIVYLFFIDFYRFPLIVIEFIIFYVFALIFIDFH